MARDGHTLTVELPPRPEAGRLAREAVQPLADAVHPETFAKLRLLVTELVIAALPQRESEGPLELTVELRDDRLYGRVALRSPREDRDGPRPRQLGLFLVERLADSWSREPGSAVCFELAVRPPPRRGAPRTPGQ